jgi:hypothetical protein
LREVVARKEQEKDVRKKRMSFADGFEGIGRSIAISPSSWGDISALISPIRIRTDRIT